jgi:hypothetical protein
LHYPRGHGGLEFAELASVVDIQNRVIEVHVIEGVKRFATQGKAMSLPG